MDTISGMAEQRHLENPAIADRLESFATLLDLAGASPYSSQASAKPQAPVAPAAPTALVASAAKWKINLRWTQSTSSGVTQNKVYRSTTSGGPYSLLATLSATTTYSDSNVGAGQTYYYVITAVNGGGQSGYSNQASAKGK